MCGWRDKECEWELRDCVWSSAYLFCMFMCFEMNESIAFVQSDLIDMRSYFCPDYF